MNGRHIYPKSMLAHLIPLISVICTEIYLISLALVREQEQPDGDGELAKHAMDAAGADEESRSEEELAHR